MSVHDNCVINCNGDAPAQNKMQNEQRRIVFTAIAPGNDDSGRNMSSRQGVS